MIDSSTTRDRILADIRFALKDTTPHVVVDPIDINTVFRKQEEGLADGFVRAFTAIDGQMFRCEDDVQLINKLDGLIKQRNWANVASRSRLLERYREEEGVGWSTTSPDNRDMEHVEVGITDCEYLVARTGTIVMSTAQPAGRAFPVYVPIHIVIARESQLVYDLDEVIIKMEQRYQTDYPSAWYLVSGPSRTGDIEKTLVLGVHGPIEVYVFLVK